jgi:hypothetical protein
MESVLRHNPLFKPREKSGITRQGETIMEQSEEKAEQAAKDSGSEALPENVIRVNFGQARPDPEVEVEASDPNDYPYDISTFPEDPLALKKLGVFKRYIEEGMVSLTLDPRIKGVSVPDRFADRPELVLNFSYRFFIDDFLFNEHGVCASLSFSGRPFCCVVPWAAVKMMLSHYDNAVAVFDADMLY